MFTLTNEQQMLLDAAYAFSFDEPMEDEFENDRYELLYPFLNILPEKFCEPIQSHTLFKNNDLMLQFQQWCEQTITHIGGAMTASYEKREEIVSKFSPTGRHIYLQSLHDGRILLAQQQGPDYVMLLDTSGGFTVESIVQLTFKNATFDGVLELYYIYDELIEVDGRFGLRILSSGGYPFKEATIFFEDVLAEYYYRPSVFVEPHGVETWEDFVAALPSEDRLVILEQHQFVPITRDALTVKVDGIWAGEHFLGRDDQTARKRIYCATYENPYAHFSEELPLDELYNAVFGDDQTLKVRAFNTIFARGEEVAAIVNTVLRDAIPNDEDMYFSIMANHFQKLGCLEQDNAVKWCDE